MGWYDFLYDPDLLNITDHIVYGESKEEFEMEKELKINKMRNSILPSEEKTDWMWWVLVPVGAVLAIGIVAVVGKNF